MIANSICCKTSLVQLVKEYSKDLKAQSLGQADQNFLVQLYIALYPFYNFTKLALDSALTISTIQSVYIKLLNHIKRISNRKGKYYLYNTRIVNAFQSEKVTEKFAKYKGYLNKSLIYLITLVLDPWIKGTLLPIEYPNNPTKLANV